MGFLYGTHVGPLWATPYSILYGVSLWDPYGSHVGLLLLSYQAYKPCTRNFLSKAQRKGKINLQTLIVMHIVSMWNRSGINVGRSIWDFFMGPMWVLCGQPHIQFYMGFIYGTHMGPMWVFYICYTKSTNSECETSCLSHR